MNSFIGHLVVLQYVTVHRVEQIWSAKTCLNANLTQWCHKYANEYVLPPQVSQNPVGNTGSIVGFQPVPVLKPLFAFPRQKGGFWAGKIVLTSGLKMCWWVEKCFPACGILVEQCNNDDYFTAETCKRANECIPSVSIYLQKEQIRVPAVYAICQYARITLNTAQTSTVCYSPVNNTYQHCIIIHSSSQEQTLASDREPFWWKKG